MECPQCKAQEMGAGIIPCIERWTWAVFSSEEDAEAYTEWLQQWGHDHRGIAARPGLEDMEWLVRFRMPQGKT